MKALRRDIQALRGLAVLLVVLHHAHVGISAGFLGVDIFFVISGFLITGIIRDGIVRGDFSFREFYFRRAKRLLPAAYATFLVTLLLAPIFLADQEFLPFVKQLIGAVTFTGNIVLWQQTGYFDGASDLKPLLHVWSLSLEEQYYFLLPATLVFVPKRRWIAVALVGLFVSLVLCVAGSFRSPSATFYLLPMRAWELGIGSLSALLPSWKWLTDGSRRLAPLAVAALLLIPTFSAGGTSPGPDAMLVCVATAAIILGNSPWINASRSANALARIGDFSYSLYLVHWPIFAFANNAWTARGMLPLGARCALAVLSVAIGYLLYRFVEDPSHRAKIGFSPKLVAAGFAASSGLVLLSVVAMNLSSSGDKYKSLRMGVVGLGIECAFTENFEAKPGCETSRDPTTLVWGDSYAMHLVPGIRATSGTEGIVQATRGFCGPLLDVAPIVRLAGSPYNRDWSENCISFNRSVAKYLAATPSIRVVVLSTPLTQYIDSSTYRALVRSGNQFTVREPNVTVGLEGLARTVSMVRASGKRVIIVAPPPFSGFDVGMCLERRAEHKFTIGATPGCEIPMSDYRRLEASELALLDRLSAEIGLPVFRFDPLLCNETRCLTQLDDTFLYGIRGHLSQAGSELLGHRLDIANALRTGAR